MKLSQIRDAWGKPMVVTSGLRSAADQARINPKAPHSKHMAGQAADILDEDGSFKKWIQENMSLMEHIDVYFEDFATTVNWAHIQSVPPGSGHRVFIP